MNKSASSAIVGFLVFAAGLGGLLAGHELGKAESKSCQCGGWTSCPQPMPVCDYPPDPPPCDLPSCVSPRAVCVHGNPANEPCADCTDDEARSHLPRGFRALTEKESSGLPPPIPDDVDRVGEAWQWVRNADGEYRYIKLLSRSVPSA